MFIVFRTGHDPAISTVKEWRLNQFVHRNIVLAATGNIEIPTLELTAPCSASELRRIIKFNGYPRWIRTTDNCTKNSCVTVTPWGNITYTIYCCQDRIRTCNLYGHAVLTRCIRLPFRHLTIFLTLRF